IELSHPHFGRDADALIEKVGEAFGDSPVRVGRWRVAAGVLATLLLVGGIGLFATGMPTSVPWAVRSQAEKDRLAAAKAEEERKAKAAAEARAEAEEAEGPPAARAGGEGKAKTRDAGE